MERDDSNASPAVRDIPSIQSLDEWRALLAEITDIRKIKELHDIAEIHRQYAKDEARQRLAGAAKLEAAYRGGEVLDEKDLAANRYSGSTLQPLGLDKFTSSRWQKLYGLGRRRLDRYISDADEPTYNGCIHWSEKTRVVSSETNEWYTPKIYVDRARDVLGGIDLDPASTVEANETVKAKTFYTIRQDGLAQPWKGRVWLNPPYGRIAGQFIERLILEHVAGNVPAAVALVNAHTTDTIWFQPLWDYTLCFTDHRIDFAEGTATRKGSTHGSVFVYLGPDPTAFAALFKDFGAVVRRWPK